MGVLDISIGTDDKGVLHVGRPSEQQSGDGNRITKLPRLIALVVVMPSDGNKHPQGAVSIRVVPLARL